MAAPDFSRGYFRIPRDVYIELLESGERDALLVYLELVSRAAYRDGKRVGATGVVELKVGQCLAGRAELANRTSTSEAKVRRALTLLSNRQLISHETTSRGMVVTVLGLSGIDEVEDAKQPANSQPNSRETAAKQPADRQQNSHETATNEDQRSEIRSGEIPTPRAHAIPPSTEPQSHHPAKPSDPEEAERAARRALGDEVWRELGEARATIAVALGVELRPLHPQDPGRTALAMRILESGTVDRARADCTHVLQVRRAEAVFKAETKWLSGSMFEERGWRTALAASIAEASKPRPPMRAPSNSPGLRVVRSAEADDMPPIRPSLRRP